jgi:hypothetical protein
MAEDELAALAEHWDQKTRACRKAGDVATILGAAQNAVEALESAIGPRAQPSATQAAALKTLRKITYNCAADAYPGWELNMPPVKPEDLVSAAALARKSLRLVEELHEDAEKHGHAVWLIGALDLAQDRRQAAVESFRAAADFHAEAKAPALAALAEGYIGIATGEAAAFDAAVLKIAAVGDADGQALIDQLTIARQIYGPL